MRQQKILILFMILIISGLSLQLKAQDFCNEEPPGEVNIVCLANVEDCLLCKYQNRFIYKDKEEEGIWWHQLPHSMVGGQEAYFIEAKMIEVSALSKALLTAQPIWLSGNTRRNSFCLEGSDIFFYYMSSEDPLQTRLFYLWNSHRSIFLSEEVFELPDDFSEQLNFKLLHIKYCKPQP